ncbi:MAG TPA: FG-GAP-like repeat-containing protein, partial [Candidatus Krumholzibacteria bacterium]|nr:FG-GAP-like repeat-containing protein [Candidatus Krumholzibacteria bacterium]
VHDSNFDSLFTFQDADSDLVPDNTESLEGAEFDFFLTDLTNPFVRRFHPDYGFNVLFRHTGSGVYIWHVDERVVADAEARGYLPDDYAARKGVDLEEADGVQDLDRPGSAAIALGSHFDSYRLGDENNPVFGPGTKPASRTNAGAETGVTVETLSEPGLRMRVSIARSNPYTDTHTRWSASASKQAASVVDLDAAGTPEIVTLGHDAGVFILDESGREKVDLDANPATIEPFIALPGVDWIGPPAFANLDGTADVEIVATSTTGDIYVWKASGAEFVPAVPFAGLSDAAPPLLVDINGGAPEITYAARGSTTEIGFVDAATGAFMTPPAAASMWPLSFPAQLVTPLALARGGIDGLVACGVDTTASRVVVGWTPFELGASPWTRTIPVPSGWDATTFIPSAPAVGDIDHDDDDEIVIATPDGSVLVFDMTGGGVSMESGTLSARYPTAPVLGDVDNDGTLEIAIADAENLYLLKSNARPMLDWPRPIRPESAGEAPPIRPLRELESPLIADIDANDAVEVIFALDDGTLAAFRADGTHVASFPRPAPAEPGAAPSVANISGGGAIVVLGSYASLNGLDTVVDTLASTPSSSLSIQSLGAAIESPYWPMARADLARTGRVLETRPLRVSASTFDEESFIIYPNPVKADAVHARVTTNTAARVRVSIYTLEGIVASVHEYDVNPSGLIGTPFDEGIDVSNLKSGIYLMRLDISGSGGNGAVYKPFAIRR